MGDFGELRLPVAKRAWNLFTYSLIPVGTLMLVFVATSSVSPAQGHPAYVRLVRRIEIAEVDQPRPAGLAFLPETNVFLISQANDPTRAMRGAETLILLTPYGELTDTVSLGASRVDPVNLVFDSQAQRLWFLDAATRELVAIRVEPTGHLDRATLMRFETRPLGLQDPRGMAVDPKNGYLFILDSATSQLIRIAPDLAQNFEDVAALSEDRLVQVNLELSGSKSIQGLAFNPANGHLYLLSRANQTLYELTETGQVVTAQDLSPFSLRDPQGMVFAPSGDLTDDPEALSLYVADSGLGGANGGHILELSLTPPVQQDVSGAIQHAYQVHVIDTSAWSPPSSDPAGIDYLPASNTYLVSDSEIEEAPQPYGHGVNLFEMTSLGSLVSTHTTFTSNPTSLTRNNISNEPTGIGHNPANGHLFFSDDDALKVFEVNLGPDGLYGTADDSVTAFSTAAFGSLDPEGAAFDTLRGHLLIADGINAEVYDVDPGPNGKFDGVPPQGDDQTTHFDTSTIPGLLDIEGIEFDSDTGHIYLTGNAPQLDKAVVEMTISGTVVSVFHVPNPMAPAGLALGPGSINPTVKHIYLVDRRMDNTTDVYENDGRVYEISLEPTDLIFTDDFDLGNLLSWSDRITDGGDLSVSAGAALIGDQGLQVLINDNNGLYVTDGWPDSEPRYLARFYFDPNSITMANGEAHDIFSGKDVDPSSTEIMRVEFRFSGGSYQLRAQLLNDSATWVVSSWFTISDAPHSIQVDWRAATAAGANDGGLALWIDGAQQANLTGVDNDTWRIAKVHLGAVSGIDTGTRGTEYFDAFESWRQPPAKPYTEQSVYLPLIINHGP